MPLRLASAGGCWCSSRAASRMTITACLTATTAGTTSPFPSPPTRHESIHPGGMMLNRDVYLKDPAQRTLVNQGVASVNDDVSADALAVLRYELETFVC